MEFDKIVGISDPHGCYRMLHDLIEQCIKLDFTSDKLVICGDIVDRGPESMECVLYLDDLKKRYPDNVVLLLGNHEWKIREGLRHRSKGTMADMRAPLEWLLAEGGSETVDSFGGMDNVIKILLPFIDRMDVYHEAAGHLFVHGGVPSGTRDIRNVPIPELLWNRELVNPIPGTTIVCGHTVHEQVTRYDNVIAIDTGACFFGKMSAYDILNQYVYWIEDSVPSRALTKRS